MALSIDLNGRRALVTGVTRGIGAAIAQKLAQAGCDVAGCGLSNAETECVDCFIEDVEGEGRQAYYTTVDLSDPAAPARWVADAAEALGGIDIVVSNAGRNFFKGVAACDEPAWQACLDLNLAAHWRLARAARPFLETGVDPVIIVIASNHAFYTMPGCFPYNVAKAGLVALVQSLAIEWGPRIRAVGVAPGFINTEAAKAWFDSFPDPAAERRRTEQLHPVGRIGTSAEIGVLCAFLASPWSGFMSGSIIRADGGRSALMQDPSGESTGA